MSLENHDDTRDRILNAAGPIFAAKGFNGATVRDICNAAEVNSSAVNYYFRDKEQLYVETVKYAHPLSRAPLEMPTWPDEMSPTKKLIAFINMMVQQMFGAEHATWKAALIMRELSHPTSACREMVEEFFRKRFDTLDEILVGILPAEITEHRRHQVAFSIIGQCVHFRAASPVIGMIVGEEEQQAYYQPTDIANHIVGFTLAALGRRPSVCEQVANEDTPTVA
jgi:AcrR family transcriptional regulator